MLEQSGEGGEVSSFLPRARGIKDVGHVGARAHHFHHVIAHTLPNFHPCDYKVLKRDGEERERDREKEMGRRGREREMGRRERERGERRDEGKREMKRDIYEREEGEEREGMGEKIWGREKIEGNIRGGPVGGEIQFI